LLGKSDWRVRPKLAFAAVLLASVLHAMIRLALPHEAIEQFASSAPSSVLLVLVATLETAGIWLAILLVPWGVIRTRTTAAAYVVVAATLGALAYYQPFDVVVLNGEVRGPKHPEYELALIFSLVLAAVPFAGGLAMRLRRGRHPQPNHALHPTAADE
jgi:uncharacterized YccA/Bax inhibitor family protein